MISAAEVFAVGDSEMVGDESGEPFDLAWSSLETHL